MAATMTDKHKSLNRLSTLLTRPLSKSSSPVSSSPKSRGNSQNRTSKSREMDGAAVNSGAWPLPELSSTPESHPQDSSHSYPGMIGYLPVASPEPLMPQQFNSSQATRQRAVSTSQAQSHYQTLDPRFSGQSTMSSYSSKSATDLQRLAQTQHALNSRKSHGNLRSQPSAASHLQKKPPTTIPNAKVDPSLNYMTPATAKDPTLKKKKGGGLFGGRSKNVEKIIGPSAWVVGEEPKIPYDVALLAGGAKVSLECFLSSIYDINEYKVPELWQESGNALVYLFPPASGRGPSFRLSSEVISSSPGLTAFVHGDVYSSRATSQMSQHSRPGATFDPRTQQVQIHTPGGTSVGASPNTSHTSGSEDSREARGLVDVDSQLLHIRLPISLSDESGKNLSQVDVRNLVSVRNLFAFLVGQSLIATPEQPTVFEVFNQISKHLQEFKFSNMDGSTFGETPDSSFTSYLQELVLLDMRNNCEKTIEGLLLGERMRSAVLWNEAFVHGVGLYKDLQRVCPDKFKMLSSVAVQRLERAHMDLEKRQRRIDERLSDFDFPSIFHGIMNSRTAEERETASFEQWKSSFQATRRFLLQHLKGKLGAWPPKKVKKSAIQVPNLNRRVLKVLGDDLAVLYDLMVDRQHPSSRLVIFGKQFPAHPDPQIEALRKVLQEYDVSGSPVYPTMPFDAPLLPHLSRSHANSEASSKKKIGKSDLVTILSNSYNKDIRDSRNPVAQLWIAFEAKTTSGMTMDKITNFRLGAWLFMYCVLQSLPLLTVDAPCVQFANGVDYFLCEPPRGRLHWSKESTQKDWFRDPVTGVITQMSKDSIELSDEAIYRLSHCWKVGEIWEQELTVLPGPKRSQRQPSPPQHAHQLGQLEGVPPLQDSPMLQGYSGQSSPMIPQQHQFPPVQHQSSYPTPPQGSMYELPYHGSNPHLMASPPQLALGGESGYQYSPHQQPQSYPSPALGAIWEQPIAPTTSNPPQQQPSPPHLALPSTDQLLPPPIIPGIAMDDGYASSGGHSGSHSRNSSPYGGMGRRGNRESILMMGLERLPVPAAAPMSREERNARTASMTFEDILPGQEEAQQQQQKPRGRVPSRNGWI
jgi:hypothetical protein